MLVQSLGRDRTAVGANMSRSQVQATQLLELWTSVLAGSEAATAGLPVRVIDVYETATAADAFVS